MFYLICSFLLFYATSSFIYLFIHLLIYLFIHLLIYLLIYSFIHLSICLFIYSFVYSIVSSTTVGKERNGSKDDKESSKDRDNRQSRVSRARITTTASLPLSLPLMEDETVLKNNIAINNSPFKVGQKVLVDSGKNILWDARVVELRAGKL